jgi:hypothetical protein
LFWAVLSNAAADGKRQRIVDVSLIREGRPVWPYEIHTSVRSLQP